MTSQAGASAVGGLGHGIGPSKSWCWKVTSARRSAATSNFAPRSSNQAWRRALLTSLIALAEYSPRRACCSALLFTSVATMMASASASRATMASEYASSPVAQPALQILGTRRRRLTRADMSRNSERTRSSPAGSRKKCVVTLVDELTPMVCSPSRLDVRTAQ
jgi:hypothetical protein